MKKINEVVVKPSRPEKILLFGTGNFLRAFSDWLVAKANNDGVYNGSIVISQVTASNRSAKLNEQDGIYTVVLRGIKDGKAQEESLVVDAVSRCINPYEDYEALLELARSADLEVVISNTTEAGIAYHAGDKLTDRPASSFPAKVCAFLYERYKAFEGDPARGLLFLAAELIDNNGAALKRIVLQYAQEWGLEEAFIRWVEECNHFCSTLVDRIVTGYPKDQIEYFEEKLGYQDTSLVTAEFFNFWGIEGKQEWADILPIHKTDANVIWTEDVTPYKKRKVRILNGAHTSSVLAAYLAGHEIVLEMMRDEVFSRYLDKVLYEEVIPTLDLPKDDLMAFAAAVKDRFSNPYIKHRLLDISLNSCSKWAARCMPTLLDYVETMGKLPAALTFSLAAFIKFYQGTMVDGKYTGRRFDGTEYPITDSADVVAFFADVWSRCDAQGVAEAVLGNQALWTGTDLSVVPGLTNAVAAYLKAMESQPVRDVVAALL
ncbi:MAG: tagaturonate reductase [Clostridia bacterium]|nr:tagaturonate reductase [Clostridia bacterium]